MASIDNTTGEDGPLTSPWLALIESQDLTKPIGFSSDFNSTSGLLANIWWLYGNYAAVDTDGVLFYARHIQDGVDLWQLMWSQSLKSSWNHVPVTLRAIGPSSNTVMHGRKRLSKTRWFLLRRGGDSMGNFSSWNSSHT